MNYGYNDLEYSGKLVSGVIPNISRVAQLGIVIVATTGSVPVDINSTPVLLMTGSTSIEIVSSSVDDSIAGIGAQSVIIQGLDANYNPISTTIALNGTTPVPIAIQFFRINSARCLLATPVTGTRFNIGTITIRDSVGGAIRSIIRPRAGISQQSLYTVRAGYTLSIRAIEFQINSSAGGVTRGADATLVIRSQSGFATAARTISTTDVIPYVLSANTGIPVFEKTDFWIQCSYTSNNNMQVTASYEAILRKN